jgi:hypothetical protein
MASISIQLPNMEADHTIEIDVKINGRQQRYHYKVELFPWDECPKPESKVECLKHIISNYDHNWQLIQIGSATEKSIPIMFREKSSLQS